jgi:formate dehydrogenase subunit gamma
VADNIRHQLSDRVFHWVMAVLTIILLGTAFLPILGIKFDWLPIHWIAGVLLIFSVIFHLYRSFFVHGLTEMLPRWRDIKSLTGKASSEEEKYDLGQQLYHWSIASCFLIFFFILHVYFSFLPEHRELLRSMIQGKRNFDN